MYTYIHIHIYDKMTYISEHRFFQSFYYTESIIGIKLGTASI